MNKVVVNSGPIQFSGSLADDVRAFSSKPSRWRIATRSHAWRPPTDVFEREADLVVRVEIAGMKDEDFSISLTGRNLVIRGLRPDVSERRAYHQMEIFFGDFVCEVELPCDVIADQVHAEYQRGFLRVVLPKKKAQKIQVED
jgi:HSP20 family protein